MPHAIKIVRIKISATAKIGDMRIPFKIAKRNSPMFKILSMFFKVYF